MSTLKQAKKRGMVDFEGEMLFAGRDGAVSVYHLWLFFKKNVYHHQLLLLLLGGYYFIEWKTRLSGFHAAQTKENVQLVRCQQTGAFCVCFFSVVIAIVGSRALVNGQAAKVQTDEGTLLLCSGCLEELQADQDGGKKKAAPKKNSNALADRLAKFGDGDAPASEAKKSESASEKSEEKKPAAAKQSEESEENAADDDDENTEADDDDEATESDDASTSASYSYSYSEDDEESDDKDMD